MSSTDTREITIFAGAMRRRITVQKAAVVQDALGAPQKNWIDYAKLWAEIEPLSGRELSEAAQVYPESDTLIVTRYYPGIDQSMRILDQYGNQYDITNISDVGDRHIKLVIIAIQRPAGRDV